MSDDGQRLACPCLNLVEGKAAVTDITTTAPLSLPHRLTKLERPAIELPNGEILQPRAALARELGISDKTAARQNWPTCLVGGIAYVQRNEALKQIAAKFKRRNEPAKRRRS